MNEIPQGPPITSANPIQWIEYIGPCIAQSRMFGCDNEAQGKVLASMQVTQNLSLMDIMRTYHFVDGKLSMRAESMLSTFRDQYGGKHVILRRDPECAAVRLTDRHGVSTECSLTWEQIKDEPFTKGKKGQIKDNYATPHKRMQMLWARLISDSMRSVEPGVVAGVYTPEEIGDFTGREIEGSTVTTLADQPQPQLPAPATTQPPVQSWNMSDQAGPEEIQRIKDLITEIHAHDPEIVDRVKAVLGEMGKTLSQLTHSEAQRMQAKLDAKLAGTRF